MYGQGLILNHLYPKNYRNDETAYSNYKCFCTLILSH